MRAAKSEKVALASLSLWYKFWGCVLPWFPLVDTAEIAFYCENARHENASKNLVSAVSTSGNHGSTQPQNL